MKTLILTLLSLVILCISVLIAGPVTKSGIVGDFCIKSEGGKYYLGDKNCKAITPAKYDTVYKLYSTLFVGKIQGKSCLISSGGKELTPAEYDYFSGITDRFLKGAVNKKYCLLDVQGKRLTEIKYDNIDYVDDSCVAGFSGTLCCLVNAQGKEVTPCIYELFREYDKKYVKVYIEEKLAIDSTKTVQKATDSYAELRADFFATKSKVGLFDHSGKTVVAIEYDDVVRPNENLLGSDRMNFGRPKESGVFIVRKNEKVGCVNHRGEQVLPITFYDIAFYNDDYLLVSNGGKVGVYDVTGKVVIKPEYYPVLPAEYYFNPEEKAALLQLDAEPTSDLFYIFEDGNKLRYEDHWENRGIINARFADGKGYVFAENAALRLDPDNMGKLIRTMKIGTEVRILSYSDYFYSDRGPYIKSVFEPDEEYFDQNYMNHILKDRWVKVSVGAADNQGYMLESDLSGGGFFEDLDRDGKNELLIVKRLAYLNYKLTGADASNERNRSMITVRVLRDESLLSQARFTDYKRPFLAEAGGIQSELSLIDIDFMKIPKTETRFFFMVLSWNLRGGFLLNGTSVKTFYYFNNNQFTYVDKETKKRNGRIERSDKKIRYDDVLKNIFMDEEYSLFDNKGSQRIQRLYSWNKKKMRFVLASEKNVR